MAEKKQPEIPRDSKGEPVGLTVSTAAITRTLDATISSATTITLQATTSLLEVTAIDKGVYLRYSAGVTSSNFDEYITANSTRHYIVPLGVTDISVLEQAATATVIVIEK